MQLISWQILYNFPQVSYLIRNQVLTHFINYYKNIIKINKKMT